MNNNNKRPRRDSLTQSPGQLSVASKGSRPVTPISEGRQVSVTVIGSDDGLARALTATFNLAQKFSQQDLHSLGCFIQHVLDLKEATAEAAKQERAAEATVAPSSVTGAVELDEDELVANFFLADERFEINSSLQSEDEAGRESEPESEVGSTDASSKHPAVSCGEGNTCATKNSAPAATPEGSAAAEALDQVLEEHTGMSVFKSLAELQEENLRSMFQLISIFIEDSKRSLWCTLISMSQATAERTREAFTVLMKHPGELAMASDFMTLLMREDLDAIVLRTLLTLVQRFTSLSNEQYEQLSHIPEGFFDVLLQAFSNSRVPSPH